MTGRRGQAMERGPMLLVGVLFLSLLLAALVVLIVNPLQLGETKFLSLIEGAAEDALSVVTGFGEESPGGMTGFALRAAAREAGIFM